MIILNISDFLIYFQISSFLSRHNGNTAGRREPRTAVEKLSNNIAKKWRLDGTHARMGSAYFQFLRRCETLSSAREIASMALSAEQARHTENVFHIALSTQPETGVKQSRDSRALLTGSSTYI